MQSRFDFVFVLFENQEVTGKAAVLLIQTEYGLLGTAGIDDP